MSANRNQADFGTTDVQAERPGGAESARTTARSKMDRLTTMNSVILSRTFTAIAVLAVAALLSTIGQSNAGRISAQLGSGIVYLANTGQRTTTEPNRVLGTHGEQSVDELWATYAADVAGGEPLRLIDSDTSAQTNTAGDGEDADLLRVTVLDHGYNIFRTVPADPGDTLDLSAVFSVTSVSIPGAVSDPVGGSIADIEIYLDDGATGPDGAIDGDETQIAGPGASPVLATVIAVNAAGDTIHVRSEVSTGSASTPILIRYQSTIIDTIQFGVDSDAGGPLPEADIVATSDVDTTGQGLFLVETGRDTGRFEGFLRLTDSNGSTNDGLSEGGATGSDFENAAVLRVLNGPVTVSYTDSSGVQQSSVVSIDTSAPLPVVTGPAHETQTQNQQPTFTGTVTDVGSGLDISDTNLVIHEAVEAFENFNIIPVINDEGINNGVAQSISKVGAADGDLSFSFTFTPSVALPTGLGAGQVNHLVDFQVRSEDLAGNLGFSDSDGDPDGDGGTEDHGVTLPGAEGRFDANIVKIDRVAPAILSTASTPVVAPGDHKTGVNLNAQGDEVTDPTGLRVMFNDDIFNADPSDFTVEFPSLGAILVPVAAQTDGPNVYLTLAQEIPADERPIVRIQGSVEDIAGNGTAFGSANVADGIAPTLTVTLSDGTGIGTGEEGPDQVTNDEITIAIESDEALSFPPFVEVFPLGGNTPDVTGIALTTGVNTWEFTFEDTGGIASGDKAVVVTGTDNAVQGGPLVSDTNNTGVNGDEDERSFTLDDFLSNPVITLSPEDPVGSGIAVSARPEVEFDFGAGGEITTVTMTNVQLTDPQSNVTQIEASIVRSADGLVNTFIAVDDLEPGEYTITVPVGGMTDAAANVNFAPTVFQFTVDPPLAECRADVDGSGFVEREEAVDTVVAYLLGDTDWSREEALTVLTAFLLETPIVCT